MRLATLTRPQAGRDTNLIAPPKLCLPEQPGSCSADERLSFRCNHKCQATQHQRVEGLATQFAHSLAQKERTTSWRRYPAPKEKGVASHSGAVT
jgi:hypothetical protein